MASKQPEQADQEVAENQYDDYGPPFIKRSFGGEFLWANATGYTAKILRVLPDENVIVSTRNRKDMVVMLTAGRAVMELRDPDNVERVELLPATPMAITAEHDFRLIALTDVEIVTIYSPL
ncbi:MAG: hypothetical protein ACPG4T_13400 [Nannocystaceae bacterium]